MEMSYELDAELAPAMAALAAKVAGAPRPARGDWRAVRKAASAGLAADDRSSRRDGSRLPAVRAPGCSGSGQAAGRAATSSETTRGGGGICTALALGGVRRLDPALEPGWDNHDSLRQAWSRPPWKSSDPGVRSHRAAPMGSSTMSASTHLNALTAAALTQEIVAGSITRRGNQEFQASLMV